MGIKVPKEGYENKTIYIWAGKMYLGYLVCKQNGSGEDGRRFLGIMAQRCQALFMYMEKSNIPFHTIILFRTFIGK